MGQQLAVVPFFLLQIMRWFTLFSILIVVAMPALAQDWVPIVPNRATYSITANPQNSATLYAGNVARILFKSTNAGATWEERAIGDPGGASRIMLLRVHPADTAILFAGGIGLDGLWRSTDAGETWKRALTSSNGSRFELGGQSALAFDPSDPDHVYLVRLSNGEVYHSLDKGETWDSLSVLNGVIGTDRKRAIIVDPDSSNVLLAGGRRARVRRSDDSGKTWTNATMTGIGIHPDMDIANFAWSPTIPGTVYATVQRSLRQNKNSAGLLRSTDHGLNWERWRFKDTSLYALYVRPTASGDEIYIGGSQINFPTDSGEIRGDSIIMWTPNGGDNWKVLSDVPWMQNEIGEFGVNIWGFAVTERGGAPFIIVATEGGLLISTSVTSVMEEPRVLQTVDIKIRREGSVLNLSATTSLNGAQYIVSDIMGRIHMNGVLAETNSIDIGRLVTGTYLIRLMTTTTTSTILVVK